MNNRSLTLFLIPLAMIAVAALCAYSQVGKCEFIGFDDDLYVSENQFVLDGLTLESVKWAFTASHASTWQPLVWLSYMLESDIQGNNISPSLYHWTNLLLHICNILLLFFLLYSLTHSYWPAFVVSGIFALHPVHVESVVWVAERKDVLSSLFWLLTLVFYERYSRRRTVYRYLSFTMVFILGLMAKPMLVTLPAVMLLLDYWPLDRRKEGLWTVVLEKTPLILPVIISTYITLSVQSEGGSITSLEDLSLASRIANIPVFYCSYLWKLVWPHPLAVLYPHPGAPEVSRVVLSSLVLVGVSWAICVGRKKYPYLVFGWLWFLVTMLPVIGIIQFGLHGIADRFLYLPAIGLYVAFVWGLTDIVRRVRYGFNFCAAAYVVLLLALGAVTVAQVKHWESNLTLFSQAIEVTDNNWAMHNCLGAAYEREGELDSALREFKAAASINSARPRIFYNMGCILQKQGNPAAAIDAYKKALDISDDYLKARYNMAVAYAGMNRLSDAVAEYESVISSEPDHLMAHNNLGAAYVKQGQLDLALQCYRRVLSIEPDYLMARYNLGAIYFQLQRYEEAAAQFREVLRRDPENQAAMQSLALVLKSVDS